MLFIWYFYSILSINIPHIPAILYTIFFFGYVVSDILLLKTILNTCVLHTRHSFWYLMHHLVEIYPSFTLFVLFENQFTMHFLFFFCSIYLLFRSWKKSVEDFHPISNGTFFFFFSFFNVILFFSCISFPVTALVLKGNLREIVVFYWNSMNNES